MNYKTLYDWYEDIHLFVRYTQFNYSEAFALLPYEFDIYTALEIKSRKEENKKQ